MPAMRQQSDQQLDGPGTETASQDNNPSNDGTLRELNQAAAAPSPPPPILGHSVEVAEHSSRGRRSRVVSLDRAQELMQVGINTRHKDVNDDENSTVTSDEESSYFAKHLPSPKSGRLPFSSDSRSTSSAPARTGEHPIAAAPRESDASLSFSDDDDDDEDDHDIGKTTPRISNFLPPQTMSSDLPYSTITRMHSASSLISSDSDDKQPMRHTHGAQIPIVSNTRSPANSIFSYISSTTSEPPSVNTNLLQVPPLLSQQMDAEQMSAWLDQGPNDLAYRSIDEPHSRVEPNGAPSATIEGGEGMDRSTSRRRWQSNAGKTPGTRSREKKGISADPGFAPQRGDLEAVGALQQRRNPGSAGTGGEGGDGAPGEKAFRVYWQRWLMLGYVALLNLLSDWTCYSVAPIATLTSESFGNIYPDQLVVIFLSANAIATACEPVILSRLGLRRTIVLGALLLTMGSIVKSGGLPPLVDASLQQGQGDWRVYLGFFLVGLSQPLYQCTPALLSASWFPEQERTLATGIALNANQVGIGFAFVFGTLLVQSRDDIGPYFGLLSILSALAFIGSLLQFDDAPPTPPSDTAKVMRGTFEWSILDPNIFWQGLGGYGTTGKTENESSSHPSYGAPNQSTRVERRPSASGSEGRDSRLRRTSASRRSSANEDNGLQRIVPPSNSSTSASVRRQMGQDSDRSPLLASPPMMGTNLDPQGATRDDGRPQDTIMERSQFVDMPYRVGPAGLHLNSNSTHQAYYMPVQQHVRRWDMQDSQGQHGGHLGGLYMQPSPFFYPEMYSPSPFPLEGQGVPSSPSIDDLAEPTLTMTEHNLDISIRDDQIILSTRACFSRPGFMHAVVAFTVSGIVLNTLSTFMDYLVRLNGGGQEYVGLVGGSFQFVIMGSGLLIGKQTDRTRAYYSVTIALLVLGAFALAECGVSLDADRGDDLRLALIAVAVLVGPLQPVSTELGVEVAYPLSENTVLVIQQLFSNLLSALFIPFFKALRTVGTEGAGSSGTYERPQYTFSFYLLIVLHAFATVFFATFNGRYLRYEQELAQTESFSSHQ